jgi:hypothetical protein
MGRLLQRQRDQVQEGGMSAETRPQLLYALRRMARQGDSKSRFAELLVEAIAELEALDDENVELKARLLKAERADAHGPTPMSAEVRERIELHSLIVNTLERDRDRKCHIMHVGKRVQRIQFGATGCCLVGVYKIVKEHGVMKEGATFQCTCNPPAHWIRDWIVKDGVLRMVEVNPMRESS